MDNRFHLRCGSCRMVMRSRKRQIISFVSLLTVFMVFVLCAGSQEVYAAGRSNDSEHTVRVGWFNSDHFQEGASDEEMKSGYSYEYLQNVANYTGWNLEYVYGSWTDCYEAIMKGEIDLLAGMSYTKERADLVNYPGSEMGFESYYIYKKSANEEIVGSDLSTLSGKKVGTIKSNLMTSYFQSWKKETGIDCEEVLFDDFNARDQALDKGEIDAFIAVNNNVPANSGYSPVVMVGQDSYFLAVTKERTDLLEELNATLNLINESNPYFTQGLQMKYFQNTAVNASLTEEESAWIGKHGAIKIGFVEDYMPFCGLDKEGKVSGVITDIVKAWKEELGLEDQMNVEYVKYSDYKQLVDGLQNEEIDAAFPISDSIWASEQQHIVQTNNLIESTVYLIYKGEYTESSTDTIAISDHSPFQRTYAMMNFPESKLYIADGAKGCLDAVKTGKASCTFFNSGRAEQYMNDSEYESLMRLSLGGGVNYCFAVKKGNNIIYSLLERGVCLVDKSEMTSEMYKYVNFSQTYSISDFIRENMMLVMAVVLVIIGLIVLVAVVLAISLRKTKKQNEKEQKMFEITKKQKEELEITRDRLEEAVQKAETASKAKTTFLFNMSHDIRTPMNAILGFTHLAKETPHDTQKVLEYLDKIKTSGDVLLSILNNVLEMARIEKGTIVIEETPVEVKPFVNTMFTMFDEQMKQKGIDFTCTVEIRNNYIYGDEIKLREIFLNILSNAYKYTDAGGKVEMEVREIPSEKEDIARLQTTIRDTGKGMKEEFLKTIFEEFARERDSSASTIEGTGLGMAIVKNFVELMGGNIHVESSPGVGTTVTISIPHRIASGEDAETLQEEAQPADSYDFSHKRVLLAEDIEINAEIAMFVLKEAEFEVEWAGDGQICVDMLKEKPAGYYDVILMDIQMPNLNGYEAARTIRALDDKEKSEIPIIAMTANAFEEDRKNAFDAGMNGHLGKPIDVSEMLKTLQDLLK